MESQQPQNRWASLTAELWRHTPLGIVLEAIAQAAAAQRARKPSRQRLNVAEPQTGWPHSSSSAALRRNIARYPR
jgi:hypothetical protein